MTPDEKRLRLKRDLPYYSKHCLTIRTKEGGLSPLVLNKAQLYLHGRIEQQLATTGRVRALVPKGRQQGTSTYVQARYLHKVSHGFGLSAFILAHSAESTSEIFNMTSRVYENQPPPVKPSIEASNARELVFGRLSSGYRVGTAGARTTGRSQTNHFLHASEAAYWPYADEMMASVFQSVPSAKNTEIIIESTSAGPNGKFYELCMAAQRGDIDYEVIFLPWFWQDEYREPPPDAFQPTIEERDLALEHGLDHGQLWWRRKQLFLMGQGAFMREYPMTIDEAFTADAEFAIFDGETIERFRVRPDQVPPLKLVVVGVDPATTTNALSDETGIVIVGQGTDNHLYVFDDRSGKYKPDVWANEAVTAAVLGYNGRPADYIIAERNQGGDMVTQTLEGAAERFDPPVNIAIETIHESDGKRTRAEPVALWYRQGLVHHVGVHGKLEREMTTWDSRGNISPNRIDALVLATKKIKPLMDNTGMLRFMESQYNAKTRPPTNTAVEQDTAAQYTRDDLKAFLRPVAGRR